jgi:hypothetical protein
LVLFLSFPRAKLYVLSRCELVLIFVKKADYIPVLSESGQSAHIPDVLKENPWIVVHQFHAQFGQIVGELAFEGHERLSNCDSLLPFDSFGSFHLIRLLYDGEDIFYLVEHRVAMVMSEFVNMTLRPKDEDEAGSDVCVSVPYSGSSTSLLRCLSSLNRRLATTTAVNNICSTRWPTAGSFILFILRSCRLSVRVWLHYLSSSSY